MEAELEKAIRDVIEKAESLEFIYPNIDVYLNNVINKLATFLPPKPKYKVGDIVIWAHCGYFGVVEISEILKLEYVVRWGTYKNTVSESALRPLTREEFARIVVAE